MFDNVEAADGGVKVDRQLGDPIVFGWGFVELYVQAAALLATMFLIHFGIPAARLWWNILVRLL